MTNFKIVSGLPFAKEIVITLPTGRDWWTDETQFEFIWQIREAKNPSSILVKDLTPYLFVSMPEENKVHVQIVMTGADTRTLLKGGYFELVMSDAGIIDARAYPILSGNIQRGSIATSAVVSTT